MLRSIDARGNTGNLAALPENAKENGNKWSEMRSTVFQLWPLQLGSQMQTRSCQLEVLACGLESRSGRGAIFCPSGGQRGHRGGRFRQQGASNIPLCRGGESSVGSGGSSGVSIPISGPQICT